MLVIFVIVEWVAEKAQKIVREIDRRSLSLVITQSIDRMKRNINTYPDLHVLYSTFRMGLQDSGFFPSFGCFAESKVLIKWRVD